MARSNPSLLGLLLWTCLVSLRGAEYVKYKDPSPSVSVQVRDLMKRMTLAKKIGQTAQIERKVASAQVMKDYFIGGLLSGGGSVSGPQASTADWVNMINEFQKGSLSSGDSDDLWD